MIGAMLRQAIVELRDYTHHPGARETLIELFENTFYEPQEAVGMSVLAAFRDVEHADRFVWLRGFDDMTSREAALRAFYDEHPVWRANRDAANATLIDSDNVLLLEPASPLKINGSRNGLYVATIVSFDTCVEAAFAASFRADWAFTSAHHPNTYPRLPVREGEHTFVVLSPQREAALDFGKFAPHVTHVDVRKLAPTVTSRMQ
jgi:hypothetical protein